MVLRSCFTLNITILISFLGTKSDLPVDHNTCKDTVSKNQVNWHIQDSNCKYLCLVCRMELASKSLQLDFLTCFLCSEFYEEPKTLQCLHSFCKKCILKNIQQQNADITKKCPVCQDAFNENLEEKNTNIFLQNG